MEPVIASGGIDHSIIKPDLRKANPAETDSMFLEQILYILSPPAFMPKLYDVRKGGISLADDLVEFFPGI